MSELNEVNVQLTTQLAAAVQADNVKKDALKRLEASLAQAKAEANERKEAYNVLSGARDREVAERVAATQELQAANENIEMLQTMKEVLEGRLSVAEDKVEALSADRGVGRRKVPCPSGRDLGLPQLPSA